MNDMMSDTPIEADPSTPKNSEPEHAYLGRQPILNRAGALIGFELLFRSDIVNRASFVDDGQATAHVIARTIGEMGLDAALGSHLGFVNVGGDMLADESLRVIPPARFVLEVPARDVQDRERWQRYQALREAGYRLVLDEVVEGSEALIGALPYFDYIKIDFVRCPKEQIALLVVELKHHAKTLVALKVESQGEYALAKQLGFDLFQGYYFAKPEVLSSRRANASHIALLRLQALLQADPGIHELEVELKLNPTVVMHLMRLVNSGAFGLGRNVSSVREAIMAAGMNRITRWTQLLLYADSNGLPIGSDPLVHLAAVRAHFMELAASRLHNHDRRLLESAFLTGVFSLIDVVFGGAIEETLEGLALAMPIREAILQRRGMLGQLLTLAQAAERGDQVTIDELCEHLPPLSAASVAEDSIAAAVLENQHTRTDEAESAAHNE
jgi:c-di-GMP-related signal transduction protein